MNPDPRTTLLRCLERDLPEELRRLVVDYLSGAPVRSSIHVRDLIAGTRMTNGVATFDSEVYELMWLLYCEELNIGEGVTPKGEPGDPSYKRAHIRHLEELLDTSNQ